MNKLTDSSSNNENDDDNMWKEIKQRLDSGASIRSISFEYNDYYNVNKLKICDYFYDVLVAREEKKEISKEENETEVLSDGQTAEEIQKIFDELEEYYDDKEEEKSKNEETWEVIFEKLKNDISSLKISKDVTEYYNAYKSDICFYENYFSNLKYKSLEEDKEENDQKQERKLKRLRDTDDEDGEDDEVKEEEEN
jgi:hypothetical protein